MNKSLKNLTFTAVVAVMSNAAIGQLADFQYEIQSELKTSNYFGVEIKPLNLGFQGMFLTMGVGGQVQAIDIMDKISIMAGGTYNYVNYSFDSNHLGYSTDPSEKTTGTSELNASVGYTFMSEMKSEKVSVKLRERGNTVTVSSLPAKISTRYSAHIGFNSHSFYSAIEQELTGTFLDDFGVPFVSSSLENIRMKNTNSNITIGAKKRVSIHNVYKTDKYGIKTHSYEREIYADILINLGSKVPDFYQYLRQDPNSNEITSALAATTSTQTSILSGIKKMPVGLRIGIREGSHKHDFCWQINLGLNPGSYMSIMDLVELQAGLSYRIFKSLK